MCEYTIYKRKSKQYREYVDGLIREYNNNGKKTLLFTIDCAYPIVDGVWRVLDNCMSVLKQHYPQYNLVLMCPCYHGKVYVKDVAVLSVKAPFIKKLNYQLALPQFDCRLKRRLKKLKIDFIHCHSPFFCGMMVKKLHLKRKIPMVSTFHSLYRQDFEKATKSEFLTKVALRLIMKVFNNSDEVWTMHEEAKKELVSYGFRGICKLLPHGTNFLPAENYDELRNTFRNEHNLQNTTVLLFVGRLISQKGIYFIADVLKILKADNYSFKMLFVGDGPDGGTLKKKVQKLGLQDDVMFFGSVNEQSKLAAVYAGADLFLFPSVYDTFGLVKMEAATYKTPSVMLEGTCAASGVTHNRNGYLLPNDVDAFAKGVEEILDSGSFAPVGETALKELYRQWSDVVRQSVDWYEEVMEKYSKGKR